MNDPNEIFCTPIQTKSKRLGLRRNNSSITKESKNTTTTTPLAGSNKRAATKQKQPQSDVKVNYRNLESSKQNDDPQQQQHAIGTPTMSSTLARDCVSTNCRPYRLSLSKRIREKMTKKRLEFHVANELEKEEVEQKKSNEREKFEIDKATDSTQETANDCLGLKKTAIEDSDDESCEKSTDDKNLPCSELKPEKMSRDQLLAQIEELRQELKARQEHARKVIELQQAIDTWKVGFSSALSDLRDRITPHYDNATMLEHLRIPQEMLKYVND